MKMWCFIAAAVFLISPGLSPKAFADEDEVTIGTPEGVNSLPDQFDADIVQFDVTTVNQNLSASDEAVPSQLKVLGRGVHSRKALETSLAVACVGNPELTDQSADCTSLRGVEFKKGQEPKWIGPAFKISEPKQFHVILNRAYKNRYKVHFLKLDQNANTHMRWLGLSLFGMGGAFGVIGVSHTLVPGIAAAAGGIVTGALLVPVGFMIIESLVADKFHRDLFADFVNGVTSPVRGIGNAFTSSQTASMTAQNGWDWTNHPKKVSARHYRHLRALLADPKMF